jgi:hypothetical protein
MQRDAVKYEMRDASNRQPHLIPTAGTIGDVTEGVAVSSLGDMRESITDEAELVQ